MAPWPKTSAAGRSQEAGSTRPSAPAGRARSPPGNRALKGNQDLPARLRRRPAAVRRRTGELRCPAVRSPQVVPDREVAGLVRNREALSVSWHTQTERTTAEDTAVVRSVRPRLVFLERGKCRFAREDSVRFRTLTKVAAFLTQILGGHEARTRHWRLLLLGRRTGVSGNRTRWKPASRSLARPRGAA